MMLQMIEIPNVYAKTAFITVFSLSMCVLFIEADDHKSREHHT